jgi:hypothetical protein
MTRQCSYRSTAKILLMLRWHNSAVEKSLTISVRLGAIYRAIVQSNTNVSQLSEAQILAGNGRTRGYHIFGAWAGTDWPYGHDIHVGCLHCVVITAPNVATVNVEVGTLLSLQCMHITDPYIIQADLHIVRSPSTRLHQINPLPAHYNGQQQGPLAHRVVDPVK